MRQKYKTSDIVEAIKNSRGMVYAAARQLGCSPTTIYNQASKHKTIQQAIDSQRGLLLDTAELALWDAVENGEAWAVSLTLKTLGKSRGYVERQEVQEVEAGPNIITIEVVKDYGPDMRLIED